MASEKKIGSVVYRSDILPAEQGLDLFLRVTKVFKAAPDLMGLIANGSSTDDAPGAFMALVFSDDLDRAETKQLLTDLVSTCRVGSDPAIIGVKPEKMVEVIKVAWFAMEVQFKDFLAESLAAR